MIGNVQCANIIFFSESFRNVHIVCIFSNVWGWLDPSNLAIVPETLLLNYMNNKEEYIYNQIVYQSNFIDYLVLPETTLQSCLKTAKDTRIFSTRMYRVRMLGQTTLYCYLVITFPALVLLSIM